MYTKNGPALLVACFAGLFAGSMVQPWLPGKGARAFSAMECLAVVAIVLVEFLWIASMYRKAANPDDPEFPTAKVERYTRPVGATIMFVVVFLIPIVNGFR